MKKNKITTFIYEKQHFVKNKIKLLEVTYEHIRTGEGVKPHES